MYCNNNLEFKKILCGFDTNFLLYVHLRTVKKLVILARTIATRLNNVIAMSQIPMVWLSI